MIPWGVVGMVGLVLGIECFVARNWLDFSDPVSLSWRFGAEAARDRASGCDVLCLGDSLVKHGLIPSVFEAASGRKTVNLSAARAPTLLTYFLFRRALDAGARPFAIVINAKPAVLIGAPEFNSHYWQQALTLRDCWEFGLISRRSALLVSTVLGRLLPSLRSRLEIRSNLLAALEGRTDRLHSINRVLWRNRTVNDGANVADLRSGYRGELDPDVTKKLHPDVFYVDPANSDAIDRLLRLAEERGIRVYWLLPPLSTALQSMRDRSGAELKYERFVRSFLERHPRAMTVLDARRSNYPPEFFADATHLAGRGAIALSRSVGARIKAESSRHGPRSGSDWIVLGSATDESRSDETPLLEDLGQSRKVLDFVGDE